MRAQMIIRRNEVCRNCGMINSFRITHTRVIDGQKRAYAACGVCGARAVIVYRDDETAGGQRQDARLI